MANPTYILVTPDSNPPVDQSRQLTADPFTSNIQLQDSGPGGTLNIDTVLNLGSLAAITQPGLTTYIGGPGFVSRNITSGGSVLITNPQGTAGDINLTVVDSTSTQKVHVQADSIPTGAPQSTIDFVSGNNISINAVDIGTKTVITINGIGDGTGTVTSVSATSNYLGLDVNVTAPTTTPNIALTLPVGTLNQVLAITDTTPLTVGWVNAGSGSGTVTSVGVASTSGLLVTGSPVTTSGTIDVNLPTGSLNQVLSIVSTGPQTLGWITPTGGGGVTETAWAIGVGSTAVLPSVATTTPSIIMGKNVGSAGTTGDGGNFVFGVSSLSSNTTGSDNVAIGNGALTANTTGGGNIAIGSNNLSQNTTGFNNIALGANTLQVNTNGFNNIALGAQALIANTGGKNNIAIGISSSLSGTNGSDNLAIGTTALQKNVTGTLNIAIGNSALNANTANNNIGIGAQALLKNTTGASNLAIGYQSLQNNTTGTGNIAIGHSAATLHDNNNNCTFLGNSSIATVNNLTNSTAVGNNSMITVSNSVILGDTNVTALSVGLSTPSDGTSVDFSNLGTGGVRIPGSNAFPTPVTAGVQYYRTDTNMMTYFNGTNWRLMDSTDLVALVNVQKFTTSGIYTPSLGMRFCFVQIVGGGGSGESPGALTNNIGTGGGAGGYTQKWFSSTEIGVSQTYTVGAGGLAVFGANGNSGGSSTFGAFLTATGGGGGAASIMVGVGGIGTGGDLNLKGSDGGVTFTASALGMSNSIIVIPPTAGSFFSSASQNHLINNFNFRVGNNGVNPGEGGQPSYSGSGNPVQISGAGANGLIIITEYLAPLI